MTDHAAGQPIAGTRQQALAAHARGDLEAAEAGYRVVLRAVPDDGSVLHNLAATLAATGRPDAAAELFRRSLALDPATASGCFNLGMILRMLGRDAEAEPHFARAVRLSDTLREAHLQLATVLQGRRAFAEANRHFAAAAPQEGLRRLCEESILYNQVFHTRERESLAPSRLADPPLVSVVIPCYNHGQFVGDAVRSCLEQTYPNIEVVVVEGGSTDGTTRAAVEAIRHPRVRTAFRSPRRKVGDNRNFGLALARGAFVCCLDADDRLAPDYIEKTLFGLLYLGYDVVGSGVRTFGTREASRNFLRNPELKDFLVTNQLSTAALHRRSLWEAAGGFYDHDTPEGFLYEDWNYWLRLVALGARVLNLNWEHLILYREHDSERLTRKTTILPLPQQIAMMRLINADVLARHGAAG